jgi:hypothetical protein
MRSVADVDDDEATARPPMWRRGRHCPRDGIGERREKTMTLLWVMSIPGLVCLLTLLAFLDQLALWARRARWIPWRGTGREGQISATGFEQLHATFSDGKRHELRERQTTLILRDEQGEGAPPRSRVDLDAALAVIRLPKDDVSGA